MDQLSSHAPLHANLPRRLQHVEGHHGVVVHDDRVVGLDEAHAAHVRSQVEHVLAACGNLLAVVKDAQVNQVELIAERVLLGGSYARRVGCMGLTGLLGT